MYERHQATCRRYFCCPTTMSSRSISSEFCLFSRLKPFSPRRRTFHGSNGGTSLLAYISATIFATEETSWQKKPCTCSHSAHNVNSPRIMLRRSLPLAGCFREGVARFPSVTFASSLIFRMVHLLRTKIVHAAVALQRLNPWLLENSVSYHGHPACQMVFL